MNQGELAEQMGYGRWITNRVVNGKIPPSPAFVLSLKGVERDYVKELEAFDRSGALLWGTAKFVPGGRKRKLGTLGMDGKNASKLGGPGDKIDPERMDPDCSATRDAGRPKTDRFGS